uniref:Uncharacterized protein n=1 Tax=Pinus morrisonicola TaxID=139307 RepID=A0A346PZZ4_9CONI|nr:hypothetical protein [Pinus morrisonicola]AXR86320.1 hypothetical protein [Pinus morrisonicola]
MIPTTFYSYIQSMEGERKPNGSRSYCATHCSDSDGCIGPFSYCFISNSQR